MNLLKKKWLQSRWIGNSAFKESELLRKNTQVKQGLVMGMRLAVLENQAAAVLAEGRLISVFLPGAYQLEQGKMPPLTPSPQHDWLFPAELYFLNMASSASQPWQPRQPILSRDPERGLMELSLSGTYEAQVENAALFMQYMVLEQGYQDWAALHREICRRLSEQAVGLAARHQMPLERLPKLKEKTGQTLLSEMNRGLRGSGLILRGLRVNDLTLHPSMKSLLEDEQDYQDFNQARLRAILG